MVNFQTKISPRLFNIFYSNIFIAKLSGEFLELLPPPSDRFGSLSRGGNNSRFWVTKDFHGKCGPETTKIFSPAALYTTVKSHFLPYCRGKLLKFSRLRRYINLQGYICIAPQARTLILNYLHRLHKRLT